MKNMDYVLDVKNLSTSFISDRKEIRIVKNVSLRLRRDASRLYRPRQATTASSTPASGQEKAADSRAKTIRHRKYSRKLG